MQQPDEPVGTAAFHILLALADKPKHGYSISKEIETKTGAKVRFGTLYGLLKQMHADGWIEEIEPPSGDDQRRRYYRLTRHGRRAAQGEARRLAGLVREARARKLLTTMDLA